MWRVNNFQENEDSDQSISEDDDLDVEDYVSLGVPAENKITSVFGLIMCKIKQDEVQVLSQLEMLRGMTSGGAEAREVIHESKQTRLFQKRQADLCIDDDVEFPLFPNDGDFTCLPRKTSACISDEDINCDNEVRGNVILSSKCFISEDDHFQKCGSSSSWGIRKNGIGTWLAANVEDALVNRNDDAGCSLSCRRSGKTKRLCKGGQGKARPKFSFHTQSHKEDPFTDVNNVYETHTSSKGKETVKSKNYVVPAESNVLHDYTRTSMVERLDCFQDKKGLPEGTTAKYNRAKGGRTHFAVSRSVSSLGHRNMDDDPDFVDSGSSSEDEDHHQNPEHVVQETKQKTMVDQFQEAFGATSTYEGHMYTVPKHTGFGLFANLQRVMQNEKERDLKFLNNLLTVDEASCIDVKILSRSLEAKLSVCSCSYIEDSENLQRVNNHGTMKGMKRRILTIIFNSRICSDVELDVGTTVRVHPPWREIHVTGKEESFILCTYFSHI